MDLDTKMDALFDAFARQDRDGLRSLCAADCRVTQNGATPLGFDDMITMLNQFFWAGSLTVAYSNIRRVTAAQAVAEQHDVTISRADGVQVVLDVCVVARFDDDGLVRTIDEYADSAQLAPLLA